MSNREHHQNVSTEGKNNTVAVAGRDVFINTEQYKPDFFTPHLEAYADNHYTAPIGINQLVEAVKKEKFLILGGEGYDKTALSRHIAWRIINDNREVSLEVNEWTRNNNFQDFEHSIAKFDQISVFILPGISPQNVEYNLLEIYSIAVREKNCLSIIVTTSTPLEAWGATSTQNIPFWRPPSKTPLYEQKALENVLISELSKEKGSLPGELKKNAFHKGGYLCGTLLLEDIAKHLKTPEAIKLFIKSLITLKGPLDRATLGQLIQTCQDDNQAIQQWFYMALKQNEQLIALGLCLFDGLHDHQFFEIMAQLVEVSWRKRDESLLALDYCDLNGLSNYYSLTRINDEGLHRIESFLPEQRQKLLRVLWKTHRRHILAAIPIMERLVRESRMSSFLDMAFFNVDPGNSKFREIMSENFCLLGIFSLPTIEGALVRLAAEEDAGLQVVAARAMARWRYYKKDNLLFDTLQRWQNESTALRTIELSLERDDERDKNSNSPVTYLKATIVMIVGFASLYDPPNQLNNKLCELIKQLAGDTDNELIYQRYVHYVLPQVVSMHAQRLKEVLEDIVIYHRLNDAISENLATAYRRRPNEIFTILNKWFQECDKNNKDFKNSSRKEALLATVALTYGKLQLKDNSTPISAKDAYNILSTILSSERSTYIRESVMEAISRRAVVDTPNLHTCLLPFHDNMYRHERTRLIRELVNAHLKQREAFDGDAEFSYKERKYKFWVQKPIDFTQIEYLMRIWLKDNTSRQKPRIAMRFMLSSYYIKFKQTEEQALSNPQIPVIKSDYQISSYTPEYEPPVFSPDESEELNWFQKIAAWWVSRNDQKYHTKLRDLLPRLLKFTAIQDNKYMLNKLIKDKDLEIKKLASKLKETLDLITERGSLIGILIFILFFVFLSFLKSFF